MLFFAFSSHPRILSFLWGIAVYGSLVAGAEGIQPDFKKVLAEAEKANHALNAFNKEKEVSLDLGAAESYSRLTDAFLIDNQPQKAKELLLLSFDEPTAFRFVSTTAVKFGAPIPTIPSGLEPNQVYLWKMETLISLAHGHRFDDAISTLDDFPADKKTPPVRIRFLKLVAQRCLEAKDEKKCREVASLMWKAFQELNKDEVFHKLIYSIDLVNLAAKFQSKEPLKKLLPTVNLIFAEPIHTSNLDVDQISRLMRQLGVANAVAGDFVEAIKFLKWSREYRLKTKSEFADNNSSQVEIELAYAEVFRLKKDFKQSLQHTIKALEWISKLDTERDSDIARTIDGGNGFFSSVANLLIGSETKQVILAQIKLNRLDEADKTWNAMPTCIQKMICQIEAARYLMSLGNQSAAENCAKKCLGLIDSKSSIQEEIVFTVSAMNILNHCNNMKERDRLSDKLIAKVGATQNTNARKSLASELVELGMLEKAYELIQSIEEEHQRAEPLSRLALALAKKR